MLFIVSLLVFASGMAGMLLFDSIAMRWVSAAVCLIGVVLLIIYYQHMYNKLLKRYHKNKDLLNKTKEDEQKRQIADNEIEQLRQKIAKMDTLPLVPPNLPLREKVLKLQKFLETYRSYSADHRKCFAELKDAADSYPILQELKKGTTNVLRQLNNTSLPLDQPLDETTVHQLQGELMRLALAAIDCTQEHPSSSTHRGVDSLALQVVTGRLTSDDAAGQATLANKNVLETEKEYRVLLELVRSLNLSDGNLIVHDKLLK